MVDARLIVFSKNENINIAIQQGKEEFYLKNETSEIFFTGISSHNNFGLKAPFMKNLRAHSKSVANDKKIQNSSIFITFHQKNAVKYNVFTFLVGYFFDLIQLLLLYHQVISQKEVNDLDKRSKVFFILISMEMFRK